MEDMSTCVSYTQILSRRDKAPATPGTCSVFLQEALDTDCVSDDSGYNFSSTEGRGP